MSHVDEILVSIRSGKLIVGFQAPPGFQTMLLSDCGTFFLLSSDSVECTVGPRQSDLELFFAFFKIDCKDNFNLGGGTAEAAAAVFGLLFLATAASTSA